mgnify:CR=1 FL=1
MRTLTFAVQTVQQSGGEDTEPPCSAAEDSPTRIRARSKRTLSASSNSVPDTDHGEPDFIDYDNDGDLDLFTCAELLPERLVENAGPGGGQPSAAGGGL